MRLYHPLLLSSLCWVLLPGVVLAVEPTPRDAGLGTIQQQEMLLEPMETDRPDFTETTQAVPKGSIQLESGLFWEKDEGTRTLHVPEALFRLGIRRGTELRFVAPEYLRGRGQAKINQLGDIEVGMKQELGTLPGQIDLALMPMLTLPTGANQVSANSFDPSLTLLWSRAFGSKTEIGGNLEFVFSSLSGAGRGTFIPTFVLSRQLTPKWGALVEYRGEFSSEGASPQLLHYAITYSPSPRNQFDLRLAHPLNKSAPAFLVGLGYSLRLDNLF